MEKLAEILQAIGYLAVLIQPLLPLYLHLILSALFPIYAGAHASLTRPVSAAKPPKRKRRDGGEDEPDEPEQKMEGMSPSDAIMLPLFAGTTLASLYYLIKWLEDPAILNKILNWYFSIFGVLALARLMTDTVGTATSFVFPKMYTSNNQVYTVMPKQRKAKSSSPQPDTRDSPLPGPLASIPLPGVIKVLLWKTRELPSKKLQIHVLVRNFVHAKFRVGPQGYISFIIALLAQIYFNLIDKSWWLTNALGFSLAYSALQLISPTTSWTGTLILFALFVYDIYFVFFTPLMVTVATQLDIPAKLVFPRPSGPGEDPAKRSFSMLGLGDIVLPGMMIGFALRFDLYLFYLRKQTRREVEKPTKNDPTVSAGSSDEKAANEVMEKDKWYPAVGGWGEKFWSSRKAIVTSEQFHGTIFPKTYFHASLVGYVTGLLVTLGVMQIFGHAQPALLYLVPGVLGALWGTALIKGDVKTLWAFSEADEEDEDASEKEKSENAEHKVGDWEWSDWKSIFFSSAAKTSEKHPKNRALGDAKSEAKSDEEKESGKITPEGDESKTNSSNDGKASSDLCRDRKSELVLFSINLPNTDAASSSGSTEPEQTNEEAEQ